RAEADQAQKIALGHTIARPCVGHYAPRDQPGDLAHEHAPARATQPNRGLLVVETRLFVASVQKLSFVVVDQLDGPVHGIPIHVHVENRQKDRNAHDSFFHVERLIGFDHLHHVPLGRGQDVTLTARPRTNRIAEKGDDPDRDDPHNYAERPPEPPDHQCENPRRCDEWPSLGRDPHSRSVPVIRRYASRYRSLVAWTTSAGSGGGGASPFHLPCCFRSAR